MNILPTPGDEGQYTPSFDLDGGSLTPGPTGAQFAATVVSVNLDGTVNLQVLNSNGSAQYRSSVPIQQPDGPQISGGVAAFTYLPMRIAYQRSIYVAPPAPTPAPPAPSPSPSPSPAPAPVTGGRR